MTQPELASLIGATRESVHNTLNTFARQGWIEFQRGSVRILQPEGLRVSIPEKVPPALTPMRSRGFYIGSSETTTSRKDLMFEFLYLGRLITIAEQNPQEAMRCAAATAVIITLSAHYTERKKAQLVREAAADRLAAAHLEWKLAESKLKQTPSE